MEEIAKKIATSIGSNFSYDDEKIAVITYGLTAIFQMLFIFLVVSILGIICGFFIEGMIIFILVGLLRKSAGGAHNKTFTGCLIYSIFFICFMALLSRYLYNPELIYIFIAFSSVVFIWAFYITVKKAPVDSPNKPITNPVKIKRLRRNALITLVIYALSALIMYYFSNQYARLSSYSLSITMSVLWQSFMLTLPGHKFIKVIDRKLVDF